MAELHQEVDVDLGHEFDGIREFDNRLPNWWLMSLWGAVAFAFAYWLYFQTFGIGDTQLEALAEENAEAEALARAAEAAAVEQGGPPPESEDALLALAQDPEAVARGKELYDVNCVACHRGDGGGGIGPNLTDPYWIHGPTAVDIHKVVASGVLAKGMPAWRPLFGPAKTRDVVAYLLTLRGKNVEGGKAAQGDRMSGAAAPAEGAGAEDDTGPTGRADGAAPGAKTAASEGAEP